MEKIPLRYLSAILTAYPNMWEYHKSSLFEDCQDAIVDKLHELKFVPNSLPILMNAYVRLFTHEEFPRMFDTFANEL